MPANQGLYGTPGSVTAHIYRVLGEWLGTHVRRQGHAARPCDGTRERRLQGANCHSWWVLLAADLWCQPTRGGIGCRSIRICIPGLSCLASRTAPKQIAERLTRVSVTSRTPESITRTPVVLVDSNTLRREVVVPSGQQLGYLSNSLTCKRSSFLFPGDPPNLLTLRTGEIVIRDI